MSNIFALSFSYWSDFNILSSMKSTSLPLNHLPPRSNSHFWVSTRKLVATASPHGSLKKYGISLVFRVVRFDPGVEGSLQFSKFCKHSLLFQACGWSRSGDLAIDGHTQFTQMISSTECFLQIAQLLRKYPFHGRLYLQINIIKNEKKLREVGRDQNSGGIRRFRGKKLFFMNYHGSSCSQIFCRTATVHVPIITCHRWP